MKPFLLLPLLSASLGLAAEKPNLLIIYTDDQGYGDTSMYGKEGIETPHMDRIAEEGMLFTRMRANCTVCTPSRAALITGIYADRAGAPGVIRNERHRSWGYLDPEVPTIADELNELGYHTALIGKWHLGLESPNIPNDRGFDFFHGFLGDMMNDYYHHKRGGVNWMRKNREVVDSKGPHATELFTDWADAYLKDRSQKKEPFFLFLAYNAPHFPIQPPKEWVEKVRKREPDMSEGRVQAVAFVEHTDHEIGRVLKSLEDYGLADNTVVFFTSDNGGSSQHFQENDPWRGGKQDHYDGGLMVPFAVRWPGTVKAGTQSDYQGLTFDIFSTCIEAANGKPREGLDAVSLMPLLKGEDFSTPDRELYFVRREGGGNQAGKAYHAIIKDGWKLMQNDPFSPLELYHLAKDPQETKNLIESEPKRVERMAFRMSQHIQNGGRTPWMAPKPEK
ncbi:MAG: sulfatase-like hydrolase/transferase [Akkermansiaceae bacterium]|nr:sulfatase-like hydrolase/transferase [Akkermansiaceae bacterium]